MANYLITGVSSGIGLSMTRQLCRAGHTVYGIARRAELLQEIGREFPERFIGLPADVTDRAAVAAVCANLPIVPDVVILNAGVGDFEKAEGFATEIHERTFAVNYFAPLYFVEELLPKFKERGNGKFVVTASLAGYRGLPQAAAYCASKAAISVAFESMRLTYTGMEFITVHPGFVATPMTAKNKRKLPFLWSADKAAAFILKGIATGKLNINFPLPMWLATTLGRLTPPKLYQKVMSGV